MSWANIHNYCLSRDISESLRQRSENFRAKERCSDQVCELGSTNIPGFLEKWCKPQHSHPHDARYKEISGVLGTASDEDQRKDSGSRCWVDVMSASNEV